MKKLKLEDLHVDSFVTSSPAEERGTVHGLTGENFTCIVCTTEPSNDNRATCAGHTCLAHDTCTGGSGQSAYCASGVDCSTAPACHPYGMSNDWTFCQTECCNSEAYTCYGHC